MYETENDVVVKASVPGVKPEDIEVTVTGDLLTIKGEPKSEEKTEKRTSSARSGATAASAGSWACRSAWTAGRLKLLSRTAF